jgi:CheY-like chemotaxis protein
MAPTRTPGLALGCDPTKRLTGVSVLLAEDNPVNQMVVEHMLAAEGAAVVVAENGRVAVDQIARAGRVRFDIVLMDIQMPEMDGFEAARRIVELAPGLPIVAQTAHALPEELGKCLEVGMVEHLTKPIDHETLVATILRYGGRLAPVGEPD